MNWYVNIFLLTTFLLPYVSASFQLFDFFDINLLKNNDESLRNLTEELSIELPVDHFNESDQRTYKMRYFENLKYFTNDGPIIFEMGGELPATDSFLGLPIQLAAETGGALYMNEHRYYGESYPLNVDDYRDFDNFKYLSARQSLADVAALLKMLKEKPEFKNSKVVAIGGSYPGNLASWIRQLYPDLVDAAHASSAPVLAKDDFFEYTEKVSEALKKYCKPEDFERIKNMFNRWDGMLNTETGIDQLKKELNVCDDFNLKIPLNRYMLFWNLTVKFNVMAQYGSPSSITEQCSTIETPVFQECYNTTLDNVINGWRNSQPYSWYYQKCNEFGYFKTLASKDQIFTNNLQIDLFHSLCKGVFGSEFTEDRMKQKIEEVNKMFGGKTPNVTKVVFVNGDIDPWSRLGITEDLSPEAPARLLQGTSHCQDVVPTQSDIPAIQEIQEFSKKMIKKWIGL